MYSSALTLVKFLPLEFTQARNIILSASPKNMVIESPLKIDLKIDYIQDVHQICYPLQPALASLPESVGRAIENLIESKEMLVINENDLNLIQQCIEHSYTMCSHVIECCFELTLSPRQGSAPRLPFKQLPIYNMLCFMLVNIEDVKIIQRVIECMIDQLRFPSRNTHFFAKFLIEIFALKFKTKDSSTSINDIITTSLFRRAESTPLPWGLEVVLSELLMNKELGFMDNPSIHSDANMLYIRSILTSLCEEI